MNQDLSIIELFLHASFAVKVVMGILLWVSGMSWYWIFRKWFSIRDARNRTDKFERDFWSGGELASLYQSAVNDRHNAGQLERIFEAGYREFTKLRGQKTLDPTAVGNVGVNGSSGSLTVASGGNLTTESAFSKFTRAPFDMARSVFGQKK